MGLNREIEQKYFHTKCTLMPDNFLWPDKFYGHHGHRGHQYSVSSLTRVTITSVKSLEYSPESHQSSQLTIPESLSPITSIVSCDAKNGHSMAILGQKKTVVWGSRQLGPLLCVT